MCAHYSLKRPSVSSCSLTSAFIPCLWVSVTHVHKGKCMGKTPYISLLLGLPPPTCWGTLMMKQSRGEDKRVTHLQATLEGHIKIRYYEMVCCRVSLARVDTEMYYRRQSLWCGSRKGGTISPWCISSTLKDIQHHTHGTLQWTGRVAMIQCQKSYQPYFFPL